MENRIIKFNDAAEGDEQHVSVGNYSRSFLRSEQPFTVTLTEWDVLKTVRLFEIDTEAETKAAELAEKERKAEEEKARKQAEAAARKAESAQNQ